MDDDPLKRYREQATSDTESVNSEPTPSLEEESIASISKKARHDGQPLRGRTKLGQARQEKPTRAYNAALLWGIPTLLLALIFLVGVNWVVVGDKSTFAATVLDGFKEDHRIDGLIWITIFMWLIVALGFAIGAHSILSRQFDPSTQLLALFILLLVSVISVAEFRYQIWPGWWRSHVISQLKDLPANSIPPQLKLALGRSLGS